MTIKTPAMRERFAAQAVIEELLRQHESAPPRNTFSRFFGYSPLAADSVSWYQGAKGEIIVGQILATLPPEWMVFHALPIGSRGSDIDHIVVGPAGVFTINTKHHNNKRIWVAGRTLIVSGQKHPHIPSAETEAKRVTTMLRERMPHLPVVQPVVALVAPKSITIKRKPDHVKVLAATGLRRWLQRQPVRLSESQLREVAAIIDDPATWPSAQAPSNHSLARFAALDGEVRRARTRRTLWKFGALALALALTFAVPAIAAPMISAFMSALIQP